MRNAAQLREAAIATGTYLPFVGDGASVPWIPIGLGNPLYGLIAYEFKRYLDRNWPEAFKLHDWCYSPYGSLIGCTQAEADTALYEEIARTDRISAQIVYDAVNTFGGIWFGKSLIGFTGFPKPRDLPNIPEAPQPLFVRLGVGTKVVMFMQAHTIRGTSLESFQAGAFNFGVHGVASSGPADHLAGYSEHFWLASEEASVVTDLTTQMVRLRAAMLPSNSAVIGARVYVGGRGKGKLLPYSIPGPLGETDVLQVAALLGGGNPLAPVSRRWWLHNLPDDVVENGEFSANRAFTTAFRAYAEAMAQRQFMAKTNTITYPLRTVFATGEAQGNVVAPFAVNDQVKILRTMDANGIKRGGLFTVTTLNPVSHSFNLANWPYGQCTGGTAVVQSAQRYDIGPVSLIRTGTRKIGRPLGQYVGRQRRRRK